MKKNKIDYEQIGEFVKLMDKYFEREYSEIDYDEYNKRRHWLEVYCHYVDFIRKNPHLDFDKLSQEKVKRISYKNFNPVYWSRGQKGNETRGYMKLYQQHFLAMIGFPLKQVDFDYIIPGQRHRVKLFPRLFKKEKSMESYLGKKVKRR